MVRQSIFIHAAVTLIVTVGVLYVFTLLFGPAFDKMGEVFVTMLPGMSLPTAWNTQAQDVLDNWPFMWKSVVFIIVCTGIWVVRIVFFDRQYEGGY